MSKLRSVLCCYLYIQRLVVLQTLMAGLDFISFDLPIVRCQHVVNMCCTCGRSVYVCEVGGGV